MPLIHKNDFDAALRTGFREQLGAHQQILNQIRGNSHLDESSHDLTTCYIQQHCPLCKTTHTSAKTIMQKNGMTIVECAHCHLTYSRERTPNCEELSFFKQENNAQQFMAHLQQDAYQELATLKFHYYLQTIEAQHAPGTLLDIGCCSGEFMKVARERGWQASGIEVSPTFSQQARSEGFSVRTGIFPNEISLQPNEQYDVITLLDVLEHLANPLEVLQQLRSHLTPNGLLLIQVPNFQSPLFPLQGINNPNYAIGHWLYFTPSTLENLLKTAQFNTQHIETVITELDLILKFSRDEITSSLHYLLNKNISIPDPITTDFLHQHLCGYKITGLFSSLIEND